MGYGWDKVVDELKGDEGRCCMVYDVWCDQYGGDG